MLYVKHISHVGAKVLRQWFCGRKGPEINSTKIGQSQGDHKYGKSYYKLSKLPLVANRKDFIEKLWFKHMRKVYKDHYDNVMNTTEKWAFGFITAVKFGSIELSRSTTSGRPPLNTQTTEKAMHTAHTNIMTA